MESEKWVKIESFRNGIRKLLDFWMFSEWNPIFLWGKSDQSDVSDSSDWSDHQLVDLLARRLVDLLLVLVFAAVFVGYLLEEGEFFDAVGWVVAFGDGFFHVFVPVEHVVLLKAVL